LTNPDVGPDNLGSAAFHETLVEVRRIDDDHVAELPGWADGTNLEKSVRYGSSRSTGGASRDTR